MRKILWLLVLLPSVAHAQAPTCTVVPGVTTTWCKVWDDPPNTSPSGGIFRGWTRMGWDSNLNLMAMFGAAPSPWSGTTFSTGWWTFPFQSANVPNGSSPWVSETQCQEKNSCGTNCITVSYNSGGTLGAAVASTDTSITLGTRATNYNPPINFTNSGGTPVFQIDNEEMQYCALVGSPPTSATIGVNGVCTPTTAQRGIRGTCATNTIACETHTPNGATQIYQACAAPFGGANAHSNVVQPMTNHWHSGHPWRNMVFDTTSDPGHSRWWQFGGKPETGEYGDVWFYTPQLTSYTLVQNGQAGLTASSGPNSPGDRTDGSAELWPIHQVFAWYGGIHSGTLEDTTLVLCTDQTITAALAGQYGCGPGNGTGNGLFVASKPWLYTLTLATTSCIGTRWNGDPCATGHAGPGPRHTQTLFYMHKDSAGLVVDKLIMFGGTPDYNGGPCPTNDENGNSVSTPCCLGPLQATPPYTWGKATCPDIPNDTWVYDVPTTTWTALTDGAGTQKPAGHQRAAFTWDSNLNIGVYNSGQGAGTNPNSVGVYEQGLYTLAINCGVISCTGGTATWTLTNVGTGSSPSPPVPYSQNSAPCHEPNAVSTVANPMSIAVASNVVTVNVPNSFAVGDIVFFGGLTNATFLNGVQTSCSGVGCPGASGIISRTPTSFTFALTHSGSYGPTTEPPTSYPSGAIISNTLAFHCDGAVENSVFDSADNVLIYVDKATTGTAPVQVWEIPDSAFNVAPPAPQTNTFGSGAIVIHK